MDEMRMKKLYDDWDIYSMEEYKRTGAKYPLSFYEYCRLRCSYE